MNKLLLTVLLGLIIANGYAQDSIQSPSLLARPYLKHGVDFIRNDLLGQNYGTQSKYFFGIGIQFLHPETSDIMPFVEFTHSSIEIETIMDQNMKADSVFISRQFTGGLVLPIKRTDNSYVRASMGYSYAMIKESFYNIDTGSHGIQIGIGLEKRIIRKSRVFFDLSYNYQKVGKLEFRDFDMIKLSTGFIL